MRRAFRFGGGRGLSLPPTPILIPAILSAVLLLLGVGSILVRVVGGAPATPTPVCVPLPDTLQVIAKLEQEGRWAVADSTAETALATPNLCPTTRQALAERTVADGLEALYTQSYDPGDLAAQQASVDRYHTLQRLARDRQVPFPTPRQVAGRAYMISQFLLAKVAFEDALAAGEVTARDQTQVQFYSSTLYGLGTQWVEHTQGATHDDALRLLSACYQIDKRYGTGRGECWGALRQLIGTDESRWPEPAQVPLLPTASPKG